MSVATETTFIRGMQRTVSAAAAIAMVLAGLPAAAQSTWLPTTGTVPWTSGTNWSGAVPNAVGAVANFFNGGSGASLIATSVTTGTITMTGSTGNIVIGDNATTNDIVTLAVTSGTPVVNVTSGNCNLFMYANVEGTQGITKNGSGNFTFRFNGNAQNYSGPIAINGGVFTINQDSSLGNADNDITIAGGARLAVSPGGNTGP
jgi:autotransporter-associated beta strand protein